MANITDVRLRTNFYTDINTKRLIKRCGAKAVICLQKLWIHAAEHFPSNGVFHGYTDDEVVDVMELDDDHLLPQLLECGFIKRTEQGWVEITAWEEDQSWVVGAPERKKKARKAAITKWHGSKSTDTGTGEDEFPY